MINITIFKAEFATLMGFSKKECDCFVQQMTMEKTSQLRDQNAEVQRDREGEPKGPATSKSTTRTMPRLGGKTH